MTNCVIILAAGNSVRYGGDVPKQFDIIGGKPVLWYSLKAFHQFDTACKMVVVLNESHKEFWKKCCDDFNIELPHSIVTGGKTRAQSVKNALSMTKGCDFTFVHDAARPCLNQVMIQGLLKFAKEKGNAVPAIPLRHSVRRVEGVENSWVDREKLVEIQTPQCFDTRILTAAYENHFDSNAQDDSQLIERLGHRIFLTEGDERNIKITTAIDLQLAYVHLQQI